MRPIHFLVSLTLLAVLPLTEGCGRHSKPAPEPVGKSSNSTPIKFSQYQAFEYAAVRFGSGAEKDEESRAAIDAALRQCMAKVPNARPAVSGPGPAKTLLLEPTIEEIRKVSTKARIWAGAFAGNSSILLRVAFKDKASSKSLGSRDFQDSTNAIAGAWSFGAGDRGMLEVVAQQVCDYVVASH